jgi:hypothetical protein
MFMEIVRAILILTGFFLIPILYWILMIWLNYFAFEPEPEAPKKEPSGDISLLENFQEMFIGAAGMLA